MKKFLSLLLVAAMLLSTVAVAIVSVSAEGVAATLSVEDAYVVSDGATIINERGKEHAEPVMKGCELTINVADLGESGSVIIAVAYDSSVLSYEETVFGDVCVAPEDCGDQTMNNTKTKKSANVGAVADACGAAANSNVVSVVLDYSDGEYNNGGTGVFATVKFSYVEAPAVGDEATVYVGFVSTKCNMEVDDTVATPKFIVASNPKVGNYDEFTYVIDGPTEVPVGTESITVDIIADGLENTEGVWNLFGLVLYSEELVATSMVNGNIFEDSMANFGFLNVEPPEDPFWVDALGRPDSMNKLYWPLQTFPETDYLNKRYVIGFHKLNDPDAVVAISGTFFSIDFNIPADAKAGDTYTVNLIYDADGDIVKCIGMDEANQPVYKNYAPAIVPLTITMVEAQCEHASTHEETVPATCGAAGSVKTVCDKCGEIVDTQVLQPTGLHTEDEGTVTTPATCNKAGVTTFKCVDCGQVVRTDDTIPAATGEHERDKGTVTTPATCGVAGVMSFKCTGCGTDMGTEPIPALEHEMDEGIVTTEPTETEEGVRTFYCIHCGIEMGTEPIQPLGVTPKAAISIEDVEVTSDGARIEGEGNPIKEVAYPKFTPATFVINATDLEEGESSITIVYDSSVLEYAGTVFGDVIGDIEEASDTELNNKKVKGLADLAAASGAAENANIKGVTIDYEGEYNNEGAGVYAGVNFNFIGTPAIGDAATIWAQLGDGEVISATAEVVANPQVGNYDQFTYVIDGPTQVKQGTKSISVDIIADGLENTEGVWNLFGLVLYSDELVATSVVNGNIFEDSMANFGYLNCEIPEDPYALDEKGRPDPMNKLYWPLTSFPDTDIENKHYIIGFHKLNDPDAAIAVSGNFFTIYFDIPEDAEIGDTYTVNLIYDMDGDIVKCIGMDEADQPIYLNYAPAIVPLTIEIVDACDHLNTEEQTVPATCGEDGATNVVCLDCGKTISSTPIPATGLHTEDEGTVTTPATCATAGVTTYKCVNCGQVVRTDDTIPAATGEHERDEGTETTPATCTEDGVMSFKCTGCGMDMGTEPITKLGHQKGEAVVTNATCTEDGKTEYKCARCGEIQNEWTTPINALGHEKGEEVKTPATCLVAGKTEYKCSRCGLIQDEWTTPINALGHDYVDHAAKAPTCTEGGWDAYQTCSRCDYTTKVDKAALGHDYVNHEAKEATLTEDGWNAYRTCSRCDYTELVIIPKLGKYGWNKTADGKWFFIKNDNTLAQNEWMKDSTGWCFLGEDTYMVTGQPVKDSKGWCLVSAGGYWVTKAGWNTVGGNWYYVKADGYLVTNGWMKDSKGWCYLDAQGTMLTKTTLKDSKGWCLVDGSGYWVTKAGWNTVDGNWYYVKADGYLVTNGWMKDSKGWCYLDAQGKMLTNTVLKDSKGYCYVDASGYWVTKAGWKSVDGIWYYVQNGGYLKTGGWMSDSTGKWCYLDVDAKMLQGMAIKDSHGWCLLDAEGYWIDGDVESVEITVSYKNELAPGIYSIVGGYIDTERA